MAQITTATRRESREELARRLSGPNPQFKPNEYLWCCLACVGVVALGLGGLISLI